MVFTFLENALSKGMFTHAFPPDSKLPTQAEGNYSFPKGAFFRKYFSPNRREGWRKL